MKILINDLMQFSDLPDDLKSPSLDDRYPNAGQLAVKFTIPTEYSEFEITDGIPSQPLSVYSLVPISGVPSRPLSVYSSSVIDGVPSRPLSVSGANEFDCLGIGGTDATQITINGDITLSTTTGKAFENGLYELGETVRADQITIDHNGTFMGRIGAGTCSSLCISPSREPGFYSSVNPRDGISGAVIKAAGGYGGEVLGVDFRYKILRPLYTEIQRAYVTQIMQGFPFFLDFDNDDWLPRNKFYGQTDNEYIFQSSVNAFKYSRRFEFKERF